MKVEKICILGGGFIGSQIAFQSAFKGFEVSIWSRSEESIEKAKKRIDALKEKYITTLEEMLSQKKEHFAKGLYDGDPKIYTKIIADQLKSQVLKGYSLIKHTTNLKEAAMNTDLIIESIVEDKQIKSDLYKLLSKVLPEKTIVVTNSTTILPSQLADDTGRPEKFFSIHFANNLIFRNVVDIMPHAKTNMSYLDDAENFAKQLGMEPIRMTKEKLGHVFFSVMMPFLEGALTLWANEIADYRLIDKVWNTTTLSAGPFEKMDSFGLKNIYDFMKIKSDANDPTSVNGKICLKLKEKIDKGQLGVESGEGFYSYKK